MVRGLWFYDLFCISLDVKGSLYIFTVFKILSAEIVESGVAILHKDVFCSCILRVTPVKI